MSKWTSDAADLKRISDVSQQITGIAIAQIILESGRTLEGAIRGLSLGNNASSALKDGRWLYYGHFDIETITGARLNIDMCDVTNVRNVWNERHADYEQAGLVRIVE